MSKSRNIRIGGLVLLSLLILIWGISFLKGLSIFSKEQNYYAVYDKIGGLEVSSRIVLNGYQVGQVRAIEFDTTDYRNLVVKMVLNKDVKIPLKTTARIISADLMGTKAINLVFYDTIPCHSHGDTLVAGIETDLREEVNAQIYPLKQKAEALILSFDSLLVGVQSVFTNKTRAHISLIFENINNTIGSLNRISKDLDHFVHEEKENVSSIIGNIDSLSGSLLSNTKEINNIFSNLSSLTDTLSKIDFVTTMNNANNAFNDISEITNKINSGQGTLGLLLNDTELYNNLDKASEELNLLIKDLRENPKRYVHYSMFGRKDKKSKENLE